MKKSTQDSIRTRKHKNRLKRRIGLICGLLIIFLSAGGYGYFTLLSSKQTYISPLAGASGKSSQSGADKSTLLRKLLQEKQIEYRSLKSLDDHYILTLENGAEVILSPERNMQTQISSLQYILSRLTMEGRQFHRLDLRFDKPVIRE